MGDRSGFPRCGRNRLLGSRESNQHQRDLFFEVLFEKSGNPLSVFLALDAAHPERIIFRITYFNLLVVDFQEGSLLQIRAQRSALLLDLREKRTPAVLYR